MQAAPGGPAAPQKPPPPRDMPLWRHGPKRLGGTTGGHCRPHVPLGSGGPYGPSGAVFWGVFLGPSLGFWAPLVCGLGVLRHFGQSLGAPGVSSSMRWGLPLERRFVLGRGCFLLGGGGFQLVWPCVPYIIGFPLSQFTFVGVVVVSTCWCELGASTLDFKNAFVSLYSE